MDSPGGHSVTERHWLQDEAMIVARRQLHMLQQANDGLRSDLVRAPLSPSRGGFRQPQSYELLPVGVEDGGPRESRGGPRGSSWPDQATLL